MSDQLGVLVVLDGPQEGRHLTIEPIPFYIGRAPECQLALDVLAVSRLHARIECEYQHYLLIDDDSLNGTVINGRSVNGKVKLVNNDVICFAHSVSVRFIDPAATAPIQDVSSALPGIYIHESRKEVRVGARLVTPGLTNTLYRLLLELVRHPNRVVSHTDLFEVGWPGEQGVDVEMLHVQMSRLRRRLSKYDNADQFIVTRRGFGYMYTTGNHHDDHHR